jgi:hypothetical protein
MLVKVKVLVGPIATDKLHRTGDEIELSDKDAQKLIRLGLVEPSSKRKSSIASED